MRKIGAAQIDFNPFIFIYLDMVSDYKVILAKVILLYFLTVFFCNIILKEYIHKT